MDLVRRSFRALSALCARVTFFQWSAFVLCLTLMVSCYLYFGREVLIAFGKKLIEKWIPAAVRWLVKIGPKAFMKTMTSNWVKKIILLILIRWTTEKFIAWVFEKERWLEQKLREIFIERPQLFWAKCTRLQKALVIGLPVITAVIFFQLKALAFFAVFIDYVVILLAPWIMRLIFLLSKKAVGQAIFKFLSVTCGWFYLWLIKKPLFSTAHQKLMVYYGEVTEPLERASAQREKLKECKVDVSNHPLES